MGVGHSRCMSLHQRCVLSVLELVSCTLVCTCISRMDACFSICDYMPIMFQSPYCMCPDYGHHHTDEWVFLFQGMIHLSCPTLSLLLPSQGQINWISWTQISSQHHSFRAPHHRPDRHQASQRTTHSSLLPNKHSRRVQINNPDRCPTLSAA